MKIAFDAKRAYQNGTGLGHYSRTLISSLATYYPQHQYYLCAPKLTGRYNISQLKNIKNIVPNSFLSKKIKSIWRSRWVLQDLKEKDIQVYHGLSHEIPVGIQKSTIRSVVTIHDLIFERYPEQYNWLDVQIYRRKFKYACKNANHIIAISQQTKDDIIHLYGINAEKISICYQSCNPAFAITASVEEKEKIRKQYYLPPEFFLYVGSIIERKNLLNICEALLLLQDKLTVPLVVIGDGGSYKQRVKEFLRINNLEKSVIFLSEMPEAQNAESFQNAEDFPAIYQLSSGVIYPSVFEGFGIPVLEALWSKVPVITSNISCLPETGGDAAYYIDPYSPTEIADSMLKVYFDRELVKNMIAKGLKHALKFTPQKCSDEVMQVYLRLL